MIARLTGTLIDASPPRLVIETAGGVAYELEAPLPLFYDIGPAGSPVTVHTHLVVREDAHLLFGFASLSDRDLFRVLLRISGVGPKVALAVLSSLSGRALHLAVVARDTAALERVPGIGRKTAARLLLDLRDRLGEDLPPSAPGEPAADAAVDARGDAEAALVALGYRPQDARRAVAAAAEADAVAATPDLIRLALQRLAAP